MYGRNKKNTEGHTERGLLTRIIEGVIIFAVLALGIKFGVEAILSVKVPLLIIALVCGAIVIGYRIYKYMRNRNGY